MNNKRTKTHWDLSPLFTSDHDPHMKTERIKARKQSYAFINKWKKRTDYLKNPKILLRAFQEYESWIRETGAGEREWYYFTLRNALHQDDPGIRARLNTVKDFSIKIANDAEFFFLNISKIPKSLQKKFLAYPGLRPYRHVLERSFARAQHMLSEPEERILNLKYDASHGKWVDMTKTILSKQERKVQTGKTTVERKNFSELTSLLSNADKRTRDSAAEQFNDILTQYAEIAEHELNAILQDKKIDDELRHYSRADQSRHLGDDIETETVDALIRAVANRFDISQKYYRFKAKLFGMKKLTYHERNVPYGTIAKTYSFSSAADLVSKTFGSLDQTFQDIFEEALTSGRVDAFPAKGKTGGAFCIHNLVSQPVYVLLNHTQRLDDVLTMAHEFGHAINARLVNATQSPLNAGQPTSTAEVASTFMEDFVLQHILREANKELRLTLMMQKLNDDVSTIFRQIACYRFEQDLHATFRAQGYVSKQEIGVLFKKHMHAYMGPAVEQSKGSENWWVYWGHIRNFFYNYSYASGLLISKMLQRRVKQNPEFIAHVKEFLSTGSSESPKNIFKKMGIDIARKTFWLSGIKETEDLLDQTIALAKELKKI